MHVLIHHVLSFGTNQR